jgi:hypothetical protein
MSATLDHLKLLPKDPTRVRKNMFDHKSDYMILREGMLVKTCKHARTVYHFLRTRDASAAYVVRWIDPDELGLELNGGYFNALFNGVAYYENLIASIR